MFLTISNFQKDKSTLSEKEEAAIAIVAVIHKQIASDSILLKVTSAFAQMMVSTNTHYIQYVKCLASLPSLITESPCAPFQP